MNTETQRTDAIAGSSAPAGSALLPCPFCGHDAESDTMQAFRRIRDGNLSLAVSIYCTGCSAQITACREDFPEYAPDDLLTILRDAWNCRVPPNTPHQARTTNGSELAG